MFFVTRAADVLLQGGVIAYPTEGVFGLGCLPDEVVAVARVLLLKQRAPSKGVILVAATADQLNGWIDDSARQSLPDPDPSQPITWIAPPGPLATPILRGDNSGVAVRLTTHPIARALCDAVDSPLVSTSANISGQPTARNRFVLRRQFMRRVDFIVPGDCGPSSGPSEIRDLLTGKVLRAREQ
jgi:L-threonylcarbamoyladenylate synthase